MSVPTILVNFQNEYNINQATLTEMISKELSIRNLEPSSVTRAAVSFWFTGKYKPSPLLLEWLRDHAADERLRSLAGEVLGAMAEDGNAGD